MKENVWELLSCILEAIQIFVGDGKVESSDEEK